VLKKYPDAAESLFNAFTEAKRICHEFYADPNWSWLAWGKQPFEEEEHSVQIPGRMVCKNRAKEGCRLFARSGVDGECVEDLFLARIEKSYSVRLTRGSSPSHRRPTGAGAC
jgi:hypothetical protein